MQEDQRSYHVGHLSLLGYLVGVNLFVRIDIVAMVVYVVELLELARGGRMKNDRFVWILEFFGCLRHRAHATIVVSV